jgi:hypothetical protein
LNFEANTSLRLSAPASLANGTFSVRITANGVPSFVIEASTNLTIWLPIATNSVSPLDFVDPAGSDPARFYRLRRN